MSPTTTAAPRVGGHPPGDLGHGMQFATCCCISWSRSCALCGVWQEWSVCALAFYSQCVCTVCDNITSSFRFYEMIRKLNDLFHRSGNKRRVVLEYQLQNMVENLADVPTEEGQSIWSKRRQGFQPCFKAGIREPPFLMPEPAEKPSLHSYLRERYESSTQKLVREHERSLHRRVRCNNHHIFNIRCRDEGVIPSSLKIKPVMETLSF